MSGAQIRAGEVQKTIEPVRQPGQERIRQHEQRPVEAVAPQVAYRRAQRNRDGLRPADLLALQRAVGNRGVQRMVAPRQQSRGISDGAVQLEAESPPPLNRTGLPDGLMTGIESLSGMAMDHVQVHYNSAQPAQLNALAYTQGSDIHVAPGQERHLPHEAWHVVQQAQGRVEPTMQMRDGTPISDDEGLEHEADSMGAEAAIVGEPVVSSRPSQDRVEPAEANAGREEPRGRSRKGPLTFQCSRSAPVASHPGRILIQREIDPNNFNVIGENHKESDGRWLDEKHALKTMEHIDVPDTHYWREGAFHLPESAGKPTRWGDRKDLRRASVLAHVVEQASKIAHSQRDEVVKDLEEVCDTAIGTLKEEHEEGVLPESVEKQLTAVGRILDVVLLYKQWQNPSEDDKRKLAVEIQQALSDLQSIREDSTKSWKEFSDERSEYMHESANLAVDAGIKGVWKVGNNHAEYLSNKKDEKDRKYALTSRGDFDGVMKAFRVKIAEKAANWKSIMREVNQELNEGLPSFSDDEGEARTRADGDPINEDSATMSSEEGLPNRLEESSDDVDEQRFEKLLHSQDRF